MLFPLEIHDNLKMLLLSLKMQIIIRFYKVGSILCTKKILMKNRSLSYMNQRVVILTLTTDYDQVEPRCYCTNKYHSNALFILECKQTRHFLHLYIIVTSHNDVFCNLRTASYGGGW